MVGERVDCRIVAIAGWVTCRVARRRLLLLLLWWLLLLLTRLAAMLPAVASGSTTLRRGTLSGSGSMWCSMWGVWKEGSVALH